MVIPNLKGGLGNQLFQIAAAYALARDNNVDFAINYDLPHTCIQGFSPDRYKDTLYRDIPVTDRVPEYTYNEKHFRYEPIPYEEDMIMDGFFQSEKYFLKYRISVYCLVLKFTLELFSEITLIEVFIIPVLNHFWFQFFVRHFQNTDR